MYKVLIIDDEYIIREHLKMCINWEGLNCVVVDEADSYNIAIQKTNRWKPDIVLVDINIIGENGLNYIKEINRTYSDIQFLILTGYSKFEYASLAIKYGVSGYILKPIDEEKLYENILSIISDIKIREAKNKHIEDLEKIQKINKNNSHLLSFLKGYITINEDELISLLPKVTRKDKNYLIAILQLNINYEKEDDKINIFFSSISCRILHDNQGKVIFIIPHGNRNTLLSFLLKSVTLLDSNSNYCPFMSVSESTDIIGELRHCYEEANWVLNNYCINHNSLLIDYLTFKNEKVNQSNDIKKNFSLIEESLNTNNKEELIIIITELFNEIKTIDELSYVLTSLKKIVQDFCKINKLNIYDFVDIEFFSTSKINIKKTLKDYTNYWIEIYVSLIKDDKSDTLLINNNSMIENIVDYLQKNYSNSQLSLRIVAEHVNISSTYVSTIFKQYVGISFNEYLVKLRLEKAKSLMKIGNLKMYEISEKCGYNDCYYFSKSFKKLYGLSPKDYKKKLC